MPVHTDIVIIDNGPRVVCDGCNTEYTDRDNCGGFLFGTNAYCPSCATLMLPKIKEYGEEQFIKAWCPPGVKFKDWVLHLRGGDNTVKIISQEERP